MVNVSMLKKPAAVPVKKADLLEWWQRQPTLFFSLAQATVYLYMSIILPGKQLAFTYGSTEYCTAPALTTRKLACFQKDSEEWSLC